MRAAVTAGLAAVRPVALAVAVQAALAAASAAAPPLQGCAPGAGAPAAPPQAAPCPAWTALAPGLQHARAEPWPGAVLHLLRLDLREPGLRLAVTAHAGRGRTLEELPGARGALAAVNASFFDRAHDARGWTVSQGRPWPRPLAVAASPLLACDAVQRCSIVFEPPAAPPRHWFTAVAGTPWLLRDGAARTAADDQRCAALCARTHPRTAVALERDRRHLWLVVAEGRREGVPGVALAPLAQWLQAAGLHDAVNLDGGGSSTLHVHGVPHAARPDNEPQPRRLANALLVLAEPAP